MKKVICAILCLVLAAAAFGCANREQPMETTAASTASTESVTEGTTAETTIPTEPTRAETHPTTDFADTVTVKPEDFGMENSLENPVFAEVFNNTKEAPLEKLIAFCLIADGLSEGAVDELRDRFLSEPDTVLTFLQLLGDQTYPLTGLGQVSIAEFICKHIACADVAWYGGTDAFQETVARYRERYPEGSICQLLDVLEREHAAAMARKPA